jgi:hypothetical protein
MVTRSFHLDQAEDAFETFRQGDTVKVLFEM